MRIRAQVPNGPNTPTHTGSCTPNTHRRTPNTHRCTPNTHRRTPNTHRRTPNTYRRTPNKPRLGSPHSKKRTPLAPLLSTTERFVPTRKYRLSTHFGKTSPRPSLPDKPGQSLGEPSEPAV